MKQYLPGSAATPVRKESYERECEALRAVAGKSTFFPELIWEDPEQGLIVTKPVVKPAGASPCFSGILLWACTMQPSYLTDMGTIRLLE